MNEAKEHRMAGDRPILVVDDDRTLCAMLLEQLAVDGEFSAEGAASIAEAEAALAGRSRFDAVILDVTLPDGDGRDLCARLRRQGLKVPIIMLARVRRGGRCGARAQLRGERLHRQALSRCSPSGPTRFARGEDVAGTGEEQADPADGKGSPRS
jgi:CheY-like chemotaxis protein